jgi:hypothetical protein
MRPASKIAVSAVDFIQVPGEYYYPPVIHHGFLWCLSTAGAVVRVSPRGEAKPVSVKTLCAGQELAGFNRFAVVDAMEADAPFRGPLLLAADPAGIYGMSLVSGATSVLYRPGAREEIVANPSAEESIYFRGMTASADLYCFLTRVAGTGQARLAIRYFHPQRAGEDTITVPGGSFLAPVICGDAVGVCSDEEVAVYSLADQSHASFALPGNFRAFFKRPYQTNVPPGSLPFTIAKTDEGLTAYIAGLEGERAGMLRVNIDRQFADFDAFGPGSCVANAAPSGLTVNRVTSADFVGVPPPAARIGELQPGLPIGYERPYLACFNKSEVAGKHRLTVFSGMPVEFSFEDPQFTEDSCCSLGFCDGELVVHYLIRTGTAASRGIRVAHCRLSTQ